MFILSLIILSVVTISTVAIIAGALTFNQNSKNSTEMIQATNLAEAGIDKAVASLNKTGGTYNGENETLIGPGSYSVTITSKDASTNIVQSTGYVPNKTNPKAKKNIQVQISKGAGISFIYGMLVGNGGITMGNGSTINGSVYSNGNILGGNNETITGTAIVAGGTQPNADPQPECIIPNCWDFIFGKNVNGNDQLDIAQSFKPPATNVLNKVSLRLRKHGSPTNLTVRILGDNGSGTAPDKNNIITSGALTANLVGLDTNPYSYVDVTFNSAPTLNADTYYWIMIDTSPDNSGYYWNWSEDTTQGYTCGSTPPCLAKWSADWQAHSPVWNNISGDLDFKVYMGGVTTSITMGPNGSKVNGNVYANTISNLAITGDAYYSSSQTISNTTVSGSNCPNSHCHPGSSDQPPIAMPISDANISDWQNQAACNGDPNCVYTGDINGCPAVIGPGKFVGNFTTANTCIIKVKTPIWLTGDLTVGNGITFEMDPSLGAYSGVIIVDGRTIFSNTDDLKGTGQPGSYLTLLSTYNSSQNGGLTAIDTGNSSITGILYAPYGILTLANNANFKEAIAWQLNVGTGTILTYDSGLISTFFSAGPSGSFSVVKGSYLSK